MASIVKAISELGETKFRDFLSGLPIEKKESNAKPTRAQLGWEMQSSPAPSIQEVIDLLMEM